MVIFVDGELNNVIWHSSTNPPYGLGNQGDVSDIIATEESWAYHMGHFMADRKYGMSSSVAVEQGIAYQNNNPVAGLSSHLNLLEDFSPARTIDPFRWIPQGLYFDMIDTRNEVGIPVVDGVSNYTNQNFFNALDADINSLSNYRLRLLSENGNNQSIQVTNLFGQYGY
jgi:hypothetical protein